MMSDPSGSLQVSFGGHTLEVFCASSDVISALQTHLRHCPLMPQAELLAGFNITEDGGLFSLAVDEIVLFSKLPFDLLLQNLLTEVISRLVSICQRGLVIHAAALARNGNAVILSAQGGSGKSTLAARLVADGLQYLTDEVIESAPDGESIRTLPRSISLKRGSAFLWKDSPALIESPRFLRFKDNAAWIDPQLLNPMPPAAQATPRLIIFPKYIPDNPLQIQKLTTGETLFRLLQNATNARNLPRHGMDAATALAQKVTAYSLVYSNLESASAWIQQTLRTT